MTLKAQGAGPALTFCAWCIYGAGDECTRSRSSVYGRERDPVSMARKVRGERGKVVVQQRWRVRHGEIPYPPS